MKLLIAVISLFAALQVQALNILACEPEWQSLAREITGDLAKVQSATSAFQDPHHIQARPSLLAKARRADLLICTGAELESGWLPLLLRKSGNSRIRPGESGYFMAADQVELLNQARTVDRSEGDVHGAGDPHFFLDPHYISKIAKALALRLEQLDPANQQSYQNNLHNFLGRWHSSIQGWEQKAQQLKGKHFVVRHNNWFYLSRWLGFDVVATLEPKPGLPPTSGHLAKVLKQVQQQPVTAIINGSYQDKKAANWLQGKTRLPVIALPYTVGGDDQSKDLIGLFDQTLSLLLLHSGSTLE